MMRRVAVSGATRAPRCRGWHEVRVDERTNTDGTRTRANGGKPGGRPRGRRFNATMKADHPAE
eukprot:6943146-Prymnesium_polylepis.1